MSTYETSVSEPEHLSHGETVTPEQTMVNILDAIEKFQNGEIDELTIVECIAAGAQASNKVAGKVGKDNLRILTEIHEGTAVTRQAALLADRIETLDSQKETVDANLAVEVERLNHMTSLRSNYLEALDDLSFEKKVELADVGRAYIAETPRLTEALQYIEARRGVLVRRVLRLWSVAAVEDLPSRAARMTHSPELFEQEQVLNQEYVEIGNKMKAIVQLAAQVKNMGEKGVKHKSENKWAMPWLVTDQEKTLIAKLTYTVYDTTAYVARRNISELNAWVDGYEGTKRQLVEMKQKADAAVAAQAKVPTGYKRDKALEDIKHKLQLAIAQVGAPQK